jgi:hypothetical protein
MSILFLKPGPGWEREVTSFTQHVSATKKTKVLIHGFLDNGRSHWIMQTKTELLKKVCLFAMESSCICE